ncbi:hypothetical protein [Chitinophaga deserti]|uniref:hypothetical protein n=1 Tax=Chitinophaga deserti TaxID=2164099 RepID=UPI000D6D8942|nr:hypothetical protein [Chitinophaga deserti]
MIKRYLNPKTLLLATGISGYLILLILTLLHRQPPLHDEPFFLANVVLYDDYGFTERFLLEMQDQAPGPLYQFVHSPLRPLTHLQAPGVRLVNVFFLGGIIALLAVLMRQLWKIDNLTAFTYALCALAAPVMWQVSGMALTEIPSMLASFLSVVVLWFALKQEKPVPSLALGLAAGIFAGLGILGRAPFLVLVPASLLMACLYLYRGERIRVVTLIIYSLTALAISVPVFMIWKGFTPPQQAFVGHGISIWHGLLGFGYAALITLIIAPRWFIFNKTIVWLLAAGYIICLGLNLTLFHFEYAPLNKALGKVLPDFIMQLYPFIISPFLCVLALYFMACLLVWMYKSVATPFKVYLIAVTGLLLCSNFAVTHLFSSRYIAQIVPFLIPVLWPADEINHSKIARYAVGMVVGILSLETYFNFS